MRQTLLNTTAILIASGLFAASPVYSAGDKDTTGTDQTRQSDEMRQTDAQETDTEASDAKEIVGEAVSVVEQMKSDAELAKQMEQAKGIFIVPDFGRAALVAGGRGGSGVMLTHQDGQWSNPGFYDFGAISVGAQAGAAGGSIAMLLMTDEAVNSFKQENNFALNADAGITIVDWSAHTQGTTGKGDVVMWSDTEGLFAGAEISVSDISFDDDETGGFYGKQMSPQDVFASNQTKPAAERLQKALPS